MNHESAMQLKQPIKRFQIKLILEFYPNAGFGKLSEVSVSSEKVSRQKIADAFIYEDFVFVFSSMIVDGIGLTSRRIEFTSALAGVNEEALGKGLRLAMANSLPWVTWSEYVSDYEPHGEPISRAFGVANARLGTALNKAGRITLLDDSEKAEYQCTVWVRRGRKIEAYDDDFAPIAKEATDEQLGTMVVQRLKESVRLGVVSPVPSEGGSQKASSKS